MNQDLIIKIPTYPGAPLSEERHLFYDKDQDLIFIVQGAFNDCQVYFIMPQITYLGEVK